MRLIDADALKRDLIDNWAFYSVLLKNALERQPTIDPDSLRPKGRWNVIVYDKENKIVMAECECGAVFKISMTDFGLCYNFCPNCGCVMEEGDGRD